MNAKYIEISSTAEGPYTDISPMIAAGGFHVQRDDLDASDAGRSSVTGEMFRHRVTSKQNLKCTCRALEQSQTEILLPLLRPEYVYVNYLDPEFGWREGVKMYANQIPATSLMAKHGEDGAIKYYWTGIEFPLVEV